jgi:mannose/fructose/N-acetylgalactosamine-specific phosphotransferase system component IIB
MPIVLARIDDRLIHGQVTEGWGKFMKPDIILVVSDTVASCEWESELCLAALPLNIKGMVVRIQDAPPVINKLLADTKNAYVLFESPRDAYEVVKNGALIDAVNVGGMHSIKGKREILDYIFVDETDSIYLKALHDAGIKLDFRDLPEHEDANVLERL